MTHHATRFCAPLIAALALLAFISSPASGLAPTAITATSNGQLTLRSVLATIRCNVILRGTIDPSAIAPGATIGQITSTNWSGCLGGIVALDLIATSGPLAIRVVSLLGGGGVLVTFSNFTVRLSSPPCLYAGSFGALIAPASGGVNAVSLLANSLSSACGTASLSNGFTISPGI